MKKSSSVSPWPKRVGVVPLAALLKRDERTLRVTLTAEGITPRDGTVPFLESIRAATRKAAEKDELGEIRTRKQRAEMESAELAALESAGKLIPLADAKLFWSEARIEIRQLIERAPYLKASEKTKLLTAIAGLKKKQPEVST